MELNEQSTYLPYRLGRLFAVLEAVQQRSQSEHQHDHQGSLFQFRLCNACARVPDAAASGAEVTLAKSAAARSVYYDKMITELCSGDVTQSYPVRLSLQDQGIFQIGYYHQKQKLFTKKEDKDNG